MQRILHEMFCDRCGEQFTRSGAGGFPQTETLEIGWFLFKNGSGSKTTDPSRRHPELGTDFCPDCTEGFFKWFRATPKKTIPDRVFKGDN